MAGNEKAIPMTATAELLEAHALTQEILRISWMKLMRPDRWTKVREAFNLSRQETEIAKRCGMGESTQEISDALGCSYLTVKAHIRAIKMKLRVTRRERMITKLIMATGVMICSAKLTGCVAVCGDSSISGRR